MNERSFNLEGIKLLIKFPEGCGVCPLIVGEVKFIRNNLLAKELSGIGVLVAKCEPDTLDSEKRISIEGVINGTPLNYEEILNSDLIKSTVCVRVQPKKAARS